MELSATGLGSGLDISGIVEQLVSAERQPTANRLNLQEARANAELSALGQFKSALSTFQTALGNLTETENFQKRSVAVSDDTFFTATAESTAVPGIYEIEVTALSAAHKLASGAVADATAPVGTGNLLVAIGGESTNIAISGGANSLEDIRDAINDAPDNPGVRATIVHAQDGAHLIVTSATTGAASEVSITASGGDAGLEIFNWDPVAETGNMTQVQAATDATAIVDGFTITASTNVIAGAIEGVTLDLQQAEIGTLTRLQVSLDKTSATQSVKQFVDGYNGLMGTMSQLTAYDAEGGTAGPLLGDATLRTVKSQLRRELSNVVTDTGASFRTLADIGITTKPDGQLELDDAKLTAAVDTNFDAVGRLFASASNGIAVRMDSIIDGVLDTEGQIDTREGTLKKRLDRITDQRESLDLRMESVRERLLRQFNAMDALVGQLNTTSSFLSQQLAQLPSFKKSS